MARLSAKPFFKNASQVTRRYTRSRRGTRLGAIGSLLTLMAAGGFMFHSQASLFDSDVEVKAGQVASRPGAVSGWACAMSHWIESFAFRLQPEKSPWHVSENYFIYQHIRKQLLGNSQLQQVQTQLRWTEATALVSEVGVVFEKSASEHTGLDELSRASKAIEYINHSLKFGRLLGDKSVQTVSEELNRAFGFDMTALARQAKKPAAVSLGADARGHNVTLAKAFQSMKEELWDKDLESMPPQKEMPWSASTLTNKRKRTLGKIFETLDRQIPVLMTWVVDFNAEKLTGDVSLAHLKSRGLGPQSLHTVLLEGYTKSSPTAFSFVASHPWLEHEDHDVPFDFRPKLNLQSDYLLSWLPQHSDQSTTVILSFVTPDGIEFP